MVAAGGTPVAVAVATAAVTAAGTTVVVAGAETGAGHCIRNRERWRPSVPWQGAGGRGWTMAPLLEL